MGIILGLDNESMVSSTAEARTSDEDNSEENEACIADVCKGDETRGRRDGMQETVCVEQMARE